MPEVPLTFIDYREMKAKIHSQILQEMDLESLNKLQEDVAHTRVSDATRELLQEDRSPLVFSEREQLVKEIVNELFGLGPIEPLLADNKVSDILINGPNQIYVEREGVLELTDLFFKDSQHLLRIIDRIVSRVGRRVDESSPMVDARLMDGSRVNAIIPPLALDGPSMSIRRFGGHKLSAQGFVSNGTMTKPMLDLLEAAVKGKLNVLVSGGTGAGKTTLLNILSSFIPNSERIITIEDAAELRLNQPHIVRLETRPPDVEGKGAIRQRQLVINALRMRPDRIIIGEVRGDEAVDMLQAMNTGHEGSLTTIHANCSRGALSRLETMICPTARVGNRSHPPSTLSSRWPACPTDPGKSSASRKSREWKDRLSPPKTYLSLHDPVTTKTSASGEHFGPPAFVRGLLKNWNRSVFVSI